MGLNSEEEACLVKDARKEAKEHDHDQLNLEEGVRLALETRQRAEEEYLGLKDEEERLKSDSDEQACLKSE